MDIIGPITPVKRRLSMSILPRDSHNNPLPPYYAPVVGIALVRMTVQAPGVPGEQQVDVHQFMLGTNDGAVMPACALKVMGMLDTEMGVVDDDVTEGEGDGGPLDEPKEPEEPRSRARDVAPASRRDDPPRPSPSRDLPRGESRERERERARGDASRPGR